MSYQPRERNRVKGPFRNHLPSKFAPPTPEAAGMSTHATRCKLCRAEVVFVQMVKKDGTRGSLMPCDPVQRYGDGRRHLVVRVEDLFGNIVGRLIPRASEDVLGFEPHWGTCPPLLKQREQEKHRRDGRAWLDEMLGDGGQG